MTARLVPSTRDRRVPLHICGLDFCTKEGKADSEILRRSGKFQIDIIINNAAIAGNSPLEEVKAEDFVHQYTVNVLGPILLLQAALPFLPHDRSGRIVNVSSVSASLGFNGQTVYGGTKAALESMTRTWSRGNHNIHPKYNYTPLIN